MPFPKAVYRSSLALCLDRFTSTGVAALLRVSVDSVNQWRTGRRRPRPDHQASIVWLARVPLKEVEALEEEILGDVADDVPAVEIPDRGMLRVPRLSQIV
jgi:hypothetical protein